MGVDVGHGLPKLTMKTFIPAIQEERSPMRDSAGWPSLIRVALSLVDARTTTILAGMIFILPLAAEPSVRITEADGLKYVQVQCDAADTNSVRLDYSTNSGAAWWFMGEVIAPQASFPFKFKTASFRVRHGPTTIYTGDVTAAAELSKPKQTKKALSPKEIERIKVNRRKPFIPAPPSPP